MELIKNFFKPHSNSSSSEPFTATANSCDNLKSKQNLKQLILNESKKFGNYPKLIELIEEATNKAVDIKFKKVIITNFIIRMFFLNQ